MAVKKHRACYDHYVPHDVIESILFRLPVKSLLRFKSVCKQWSATISDPKFSETHLQLSNTCSDLISREILDPFRRVSLENDEFRQLSTVEYPPPIAEILNQTVLCCCDGLLLFRFHNSLFLWNPSSRTYRYLRCPYRLLHHPAGLSCGICYDPLQKDYKVVACNINKHYAVYYCNTNSWSKLKMTDNVKVDAYPASGVHFKGCIYWFSSSSSSKGHGLYRFEIVCFDGRHEKWKKKTTKNSCIVDECTDNYGAKLTTSRDSLYFIPKDHRMNEIVIMKKVGHDDPWIELKLKLLHPFTGGIVLPLCSTLDNKIILFTKEDGGIGSDQYLLYDYNAKGGACTKIQGAGFVSPCYLSPYLENMFLL